MKTKNQNLLTYYFLLTFAMSWSLWSPFYFVEDVSEFWVLPGAWGPTLAALILAYSHGKGQAVKQLLRKVLVWRVSWRYYFFAIFGILVVGCLAVILNMILGGKMPDTALILEGMGLSSDDAFLALILFPVFFLINTLFGGPVAEELGWRGFAQPLAQEKYGKVVAGLVIGLIWSLWHLPLMIFLPKAVGNIPFWAYIPFMTAMGVIFSWLYNHSRGSVLLAILLHGGMNFATGFLGASVFTDQTLLIIYVILIIIVAVLLGRSLHKDEKATDH